MDKNPLEQIKTMDFITRPSQTQVKMHLTELFCSKETETACQCLLVLDNEINMHLFQVLERKCQHIILVDGGANRLYESKFRQSKKIRAVLGDFDGIKEEVRSFFTKKGIDVHHDPDQNTTDFEKAVNYARKEKYQSMIFVNFYPGRLDHVLSGIHSTQKALNKCPQSHILLIGKNSLMVYLHQKVDYTLHVRSEFLQKAGCGLVTFGKVELIQTKGFKWNMGEEEHVKSLAWGNFLSTSNEMVEDKVQVSSTDPVFFIAQVKHDHKPEMLW